MEAKGAAGKSGMMTRIVSGVIFALVMLGVVWAGGIVTTIALAVISIVAYGELLRATGVRKDGKGPGVFEALGAAAILLYDAMIYLQVEAVYLMLLIILYLILLMLVFVFAYPQYGAAEVLYSYACFVYGPVMISCALLTRLMGRGEDAGFYNTGFFAAWMIFISAWASDTCAYFVGVLLGKHKVTPRLSPKKSVEGCIGGVAGAALAGLLYGYVLRWTGHGDIAGPMAYALLGAAGSVAGQIGDLAASGVKRSYDIKDYGKLIPGHGGIMDRFDSVTFTAPLIYLLSLLVLG